jgi:hypothetical protein
LNFPYLQLMLGFESWDNIVRMNNQQPENAPRSSRKFPGWIAFGGIVAFIACLQMGFVGGWIAPMQAEIPRIRQFLGESAITLNNPAPTLAQSPGKATQSATPSHHSITWMELQDFLARDHTNWNKFTDKYVCVNFAMDLVANATKQNINAWIVGVTFKDKKVGHAFVAFETSDKGIVWIDPQNDYSYKVIEVGKHLCSNVVDVNFCKFGVITQILQPLECDAVTHDCYVTK